MSRHRKRSFVLVLLLVFLAWTIPFGESLDCTSSSLNVGSDTAQSDSYWPTNGWRYSTPEAQGVDPRCLQDLMEYIEVSDVAIDSILVVKNGYLVMEEYPSVGYTNISQHFVASVTKSFTSALVGIAVSQGYINSVQDRMVDYYPDRDIANNNSQKEQITIEHLLTMTSGLEWDEWSLQYNEPGNDFYDMLHSGDSIQYVLDRPMANEPGTVWIYNSGGSHLLGAIVENATGIDLFTYADENLFSPLGISPVFWEQDLQGYYLAGGGLHLTPLDMAKFGYLYLRNGTWDGTQLIPQDYVLTSGRTLVSQYEGYDYIGYGYQWWTYPDLSVYYASGFRGQQIFVAPDYDLVVVITSSYPPYEHNPSESIFYEYIMPAVDNEYDLLEGLYLPGPKLNVVLIGIGALFLAPPLLAAIVWLQSKRQFEKVIE